jgi:hypothetical protein
MRPPTNLLQSVRGLGCLVRLEFRQETMDCDIVWNRILNILAIQQAEAWPDLLPAQLLQKDTRDSLGAAASMNGIEEKHADRFRIQEHLDGRA